MRQGVCRFRFSAFNDFEDGIKPPMIVVKPTFSGGSMRIRGKLIDTKKFYVSELMGNLTLRQIQTYGNFL